MIGPEFADLLTAAQAGSEAAFARLWRDVHPALVRYLRVVSAADADDVAGDVWVSVVRGLAAFEGDEVAWRAWLFATARRRAIDEGRRRSRRPTVQADVPDAYDAPGLDPVDVVLANLGLEEVLRAIRALPAAQAEVLMLRVVGGLPAVAVADLIGSTPGAVRVAAHRALRQLAVELRPAVVTPSGPAPLLPM